MADVRQPVAGANRHVPRPGTYGTAAPAGLPSRTRSLHAPGIHAAPVPSPSWISWNDVGWDQQSLANSFNTMMLQPPPTSVQDWGADSGASHHTTRSAGNISKPQPLNSSSPSSIVVGNDSSLPITSVGDSILLGPFYPNNILLAPDIVQSFLSVHRFTTNNWCSMEFDPFGLSMKDLTTQNVNIRSNSIDPLYTMRLPGSITPSSGTATALIVVTPATWHRHLGHPGPDALSSLSRSSFINCTSNKHDLCHACQLENTSGCLFQAHQIMPLRPLI
jgi:hypothetical protein